MKKWIALVLCAALALSITACSGQKPKITEKTDTSAAAENTETEETAALGGSVGIANPFTECAGIEEAEALAGFDFTVPDTLEGSSERVIRVMKDQMIEVIYKNGEDEIRIRKAFGSGDISGDFNAYSENGTVSVLGTEAAVRGSGGKVNVAAWSDGVYAFSVVSTAGMDKDAAISLIESIGGKD